MTTRIALPSRFTYEPHQSPPRLLIECDGYKPHAIRFESKAQLADYLNDLAAYGHLPRAVCYAAMDVVCEGRSTLDSGRDALDESTSDDMRHGSAGGTRPGFSSLLAPTCWGAACGLTFFWLSVLRDWAVVLWRRVT